MVPVHPLHHFLSDRLTGAMLWPPILSWAAAHCVDLLESLFDPVNHQKKLAQFPLIRMRALNDPSIASFKACSSIRRGGHSKGFTIDRYRWSSIRLTSCQYIATFPRSRFTTAPKSDAVTTGIWKARKPCSLKGDCLCSEKMRTLDTTIIECDVNAKW